MNKLNLLRPIAFFDLETTGTDVNKDRIVSMSIYKIMPGGEISIYNILVNPEIPIPEGASNVHGITDEMIKNEPNFKHFANHILSFLHDSDLGGFNLLTFDVPLLFNEFERVGINWDISQINIVDAGNIYKIEEPRTLTAAYKFYTGKNLEDAHEAEADNIATIEVFMAQLSKYPNLPDNIHDLARYSNFGKQRVDIAGKFTYDSDGDLIFTFGKNKDKLAKLEISYLQWMVDKGDFNSDTKRVCREIIEAGLPQHIQNNPNNLFNKKL